MSNIRHNRLRDMDNYQLAVYVDWLLDSMVDPANRAWATEQLAIVKKIKEERK